MKSLFSAFLLTIFAIPIFSQQNDSIVNTPKIELNIVEQDTIVALSEIDSLQHQKVTDSLYKLVYSEKWDTLNFNPYKNHLTKYPFEIAFNDSTYASPIPRKKVITSRYGWRRGRPHKGIDIDLVTGDSVMTMLDGVVRFARYSSGHGKLVVVRHSNGLETAYAHLSKYLVKVNDTLKKGEAIGLGGVSGNARGSHLHLIVSYKGNYINPDYVFDFGEENKIQKQHTWITKNWVTAYNHSSKKQSELLFHDNYEGALASQKKQNQRKIHVIQRGDTLYGISSKYRIPLNKLCKTNSITKNTTLKIGKKLIVR